MVAMQPVQSSNLAAVGYDPATLIMTVQFNSGRSYRYKDVPQDVYLALLNAGSAGKYFNDYIKEAFDQA